MTKDFVLKNIKIWDCDVIEKYLVVLKGQEFTFTAFISIDKLFWIT